MNPATRKGLKFFLYCNALGVLFAPADIGPFRFLTALAFVVFAESLPAARTADRPPILPSTTAHDAQGMTMTTPSHRASGFTLIELMIVIAIIGILAAIAVPAYLNYVTRAQVAEGLTLVGPIKAGAVEYYASTGRMPTGVDVIAMDAPAGRYVDSVDMTDGVITITFGGDASDDITAKGANVLVIAPGITDSGSILWQCGRAIQPKPPGDTVTWAADSSEDTTVEARFLPVSCRA